MEDHCDDSSSDEGRKNKPEVPEASSRELESPPIFQVAVWRWLKRRFPKRANLLWFLAVLAVVIIAQNKDRIFSVIESALRPDESLEILYVSPSANQPSSIDIVLRNRKTFPVVITKLELVVKDVKLSSEVFAGSTSIGVSHKFDAVLEPKPGLVVAVRMPPIQLLPATPERLLFSVVQSGSKTKSLWGDYLLLLRIRYEDDRLVTSKVFRARVYTNAR